MSNKLKEMFGDSGMTPKQEKKFFEKIAKDENEIIKALENKNKLKGSKDNIGMMGGGYMKKNMMGGGMVGGQKKLDVNKDGAITGADFKMMSANRKKYGGKINYRMSGGKVVDSSYE